MGGALRVVAAGPELEMATEWMVGLRSPGRGAPSVANVGKAVKALRRMAGNR